MRLIDAERVCEYCGDYDMCKDEYIDFCAERDLLKRCPTINPESLRPKGEWVYTEFDKEGFNEAAAALAYFGGIECADKVYEIVRQATKSEEIGEGVRRRFLKYVEAVEGSKEH